ncbi:hypothetical protein V5799_008227 [Amblyomma americanum]|uniref:MD-2-related lipid-recognition domain-containing protein n=1 Tax=Amblyomma americanum TaxID=6943 RepID=A0AAQ4FEN8_AMBAM
MIRFAITVLLLGLALGQRRNIAYEDCGCNAKILSVEIEPCDSDPCVLKRGTTSKIHFTLIADQDSETASLSASIRMFLGFMMPIPGLESNLCKDIIQCPVVKGKTYTGVMEVAVPSFAPSMETSVQIKIVGDKGVSICTKSNVLIE